MDFEQARFNMIEQQIRPWEVLDQDVLDLLSVVKRENFVPVAYRALAFTDMEIPLAIDGRDFGEFMFAPRVEARLLQELAVRKHEQVVEVGAGSGYMAALLAHRARHVLSLEIVPELAQFATDNLRRCGVTNAAIQTSNGADPARALGELLYDAIVLSGSVPFVPDAWMRRLNIGGRMSVIVGEAPVMSAQLITRRSGTSFESRNLFETSVRALTGFPRRDHFRF